MSAGTRKLLPFILVFINIVILGSMGFRLWTSIRPVAGRSPAVSGYGPDGSSQPQLLGSFTVSFRILFQHERLSHPLEIPWTSSSAESECWWLGASVCQLSGSPGGCQPHALSGFKTSAISRRC